MKRFTVPCLFGGVQHPFHVYVGKPSAFLHPLHFQAEWLREMRGGEMPVDVMESFAKLRQIATENEVSFEELCVYALGVAQSGGEALPSTDASPESQI
jgi:hypothetical protein